MKSLLGTKTEKNLREAFAGESMARNKYTIFENVAKADGYAYIADVFRMTAHNEKEHSEIWLKTLGALGDTLKNLQSAAESEYYEHTEMYPRMAQEAREEGFEDIATTFERVAEIEKEHHKRYEQLITDWDNGKLFLGDAPGRWLCLNCGHIHEGIDAPQECPVCKHPQGYFKRL